MVQVIETISRWAIPMLILAVPLVGFFRGVRVYEAFVEGAREGLETALKLIPYLVAMFIGIQILRQTGAMDLLVAAARPIARLLAIPEEVLPLALIRPLSGSGALGVLSDLLQTVGPDSLVGRIASAIQGSTETTFYVLTVYCGAVGVRRVRHTLPVALAADLAGFLAAVAFTRLLFA